VETASSPKLDICIVSWRTRDLLRAGLASVVDQPAAGRIIVVDNASDDGTAEMVAREFPSVHLLPNSRNLGFAAGNNQAIRAASSPFLLLLNPDTEVSPGALGGFLEVFAEHPRAGAVAAQLIFPDGSVQRSCRSFPDPAALFYDAVGLARLFPGSPTFGRYRMTNWDHTTPREVDQPMASALALRRSALDEVGLFDEDFPLYFNDVDLCYRLRQAGWLIRFEPAIKVTHHHGQSTRQVRPAAILASHHSLLRFYRKHYRGRFSRLGYLAVILGASLTMYPRAALSWLIGRLRRG